MLSLSCPPSCLLLWLVTQSTSPPPRHGKPWGGKARALPAHSDAPLARSGLPLPPQRNPGSSYLLWAPRSSPSLGGVAGWPPWSPLTLLRGITPPASWVLQGLLSSDKYIRDPNSLLTCPHPSPGQTSRTVHYTCCLCLPFPWTRGRHSHRMPRDLHAARLNDSVFLFPASPHPSTQADHTFLRRKLREPPALLAVVSLRAATVPGSGAQRHLLSKRTCPWWGPTCTPCVFGVSSPFPPPLLVQRLLPAVCPPPAFPVPRWTSSRGSAVAPVVPNPTPQVSALGPCLS